MKDYIIGTLSELVQNTLDGEENPFKAWAVFTDLEKYIKECKETLKKTVDSEAKKYSEKQFVAGDFRVEVRNGRAVYNFKECKSWIAKNQDLKETEEQLKLAYKMYSANKTIAVTEDGEQVEIPIVTYTDDTIIVKEK